MFGIRLLTGLLICLPALTQVQLTAPDFRWDDDLHATVGLVNPERTTLTLTLTGYNAAGEQVGQATREMGPYARLEEGASTLFPSTNVAWMQVASDSKLVGYVRYEVPAGDQRAMVPLIRHTGNDVLATRVWADEHLPISTHVMVNLGDAAGVIATHPYRDPRFGGSVRRVLGAVPVSESTPAKGQERFAYEDLYPQYPNGIWWDRIRADVPVAGVQHLTDDSGMATHALQRTLSRDWIVTDLHGNGATTRVVLANTSPDPLEVTVTLYDVYGMSTQNLITLEPREPRIIDLADKETLPQQPNTVWARFTAHENGLAGFMLTETDRARTSSLMDADFGSVLNLPYTPSDENLQTRITVINPDADENARTYLFGFAEDGSLVNRISTNIAALDRVVYETDTLFGANADEVAWIRILTLRGRLGAWSLTSPRDGGDFTAMRATATYLRREERLVAGFEFIRPLDMEGQGWTVLDLNDESYRAEVTDEVRHRFNDGHSIPLWGQFFTETAYFPPEGQHYLAYEPLRLEKSVFVRNDQILFVSPYFEAPPYGAAFLSYEMRFFDPQNATTDSRYGLAWRIEGEETWHWFGLTGYLLADNPPLLIRDCWEDVGYRRQGNIVTKTNWWKFQTRLPSEIYGKRIQVAYFYDQAFNTGGTHQGPTLQIDDIRLSTHPDKYAFYYENAAGEFVFVQD